VYYSLEEIFKQAEEDVAAAALHGKGYKSYLLYGIKISRDTSTGRIQLLDTSKAGSFYKLITDENMKVFEEGGWRFGIYVLSLSNYRLKLDKIEQQIKRYVNTNPARPSKQLGAYHAVRTNILRKYSEVASKLNKLKLNQNGKIKISKETNDI